MGKGGERGEGRAGGEEKKGGGEERREVSGRARRGGRSIPRMKILATALVAYVHRAVVSCCRYLYFTILRDPVQRYISEWKHVQRGSTWISAKLMCNGRQATLQEVPFCFKGSFCLFYMYCFSLR